MVGIIPSHDTVSHNMIFIILNVDGYLTIARWNCEGVILLMRLRGKTAVCRPNARNLEISSTEITTFPWYCTTDRNTVAGHSALSLAAIGVSLWCFRIVKMRWGS
jgi:hypothetical protein